MSSCPDCFQPGLGERQILELLKHSYKMPLPHRPLKMTVRAGRRTLAMTISVPSVKKSWLGKDFQWHIAGSSKGLTDVSIDQ